MSFVLVIKEIGELYRKSYRGLMRATFGPYSHTT